MSKPVVTDIEPIDVELEAGKSYHYCRCGRSQNQPFCDGAHAGTDITPLAFEAEEDGTEYLCMCRQTENAPFCDATHIQIPPEKVGEELQLEQPGGGGPEAQPTLEEPTVAYIHQLAREGLSKLGSHGPMGAMGVPRKDLPHWDDIQIIVCLRRRQRGTGCCPGRWFAPRIITRLP